MDKIFHAHVFMQESQGPNLFFFLFLAFISGPPDGLLSNEKFFEDDISLFSIIHDVSATATSWNKILYKTTP